MAYSEAEILELSKRIGKSRTTLWRWASQGCDLRNHASVQSWIEKNRIRETNVEKARRRRRDNARDTRRAPTVPPQNVFEPQGNGEQGSPAKKALLRPWSVWNRLKNRRIDDSRLL
jgi:hypothetical protein